MRTVAVVALFAFGLLAGCVQNAKEYNAFDADAQYRNPGVFEGTYKFSRYGSTVLHPGNYSKGLPGITRLESAIPAYPGPLGTLSTDAAVQISLAVWRPSNVTGKVPVIVDAGPYFEEGIHCREQNQNPCMAGTANDTIDWPGQTTPFSLYNFLPHGYAVAQIAVRGTGTSGGCMDLMGPDEVADLDQAITWLGEQDWSNGNVAMVGASYDGSTPWEVASTGNPHLKTIVPTSGLPDIFDLMFRNGTAETRGSVMHSQVYWPYGFSDGYPWNRVPAPPPSPVPLPVGPTWPPPDVLHGNANGRDQNQDLQNTLCPEAWKGAAIGPLTSITGSRNDEVAGQQALDYWTIRDHRQAVVDNYKGSIFLIHGLQDWNVDPHVAIPFNQQLRAAGIPMKEWYGQWGHAFPDSTCPAQSPEWYAPPCRLDYAEVLLRWFDKYLKGVEGQDLGPSIQIQDSIGFWRNADSFPPTDAAWTPFYLTADNSLSPIPVGTETGFELTMPQSGAPGTMLELRSAPLDHAMRISGLPRLALPFTSQAGGGMLAAWLLDEDANGTVRAPSAAKNLYGDWVPDGIPIIGHAQMNLRYYAGGETEQTVQPNTRYTAKLQFEPMEAMIPAGHRLTLWLFQFAYPDHEATTTPSSVTVYVGGETAAQLPAIVTDPTQVFPVPGVPFPKLDLASKMAMLKPAFQAANLIPIPAPPAPTPLACLVQATC